MRPGLFRLALQAALDDVERPLEVVPNQVLGLRKFLGKQIASPMKVAANVSIWASGF